MIVSGFAPDSHNRERLQHEIESLSDDIKPISKEEAQAITDYTWNQINRFVKNYVNKQHLVALTA